MDAPAPTAPEPRRRRPWWRRVLRGLAWLAAGVVVLVAVALLVLQTAWAKGLLLEQILGAVNAGIRGEVRAERLGGNLLRTVRLEGVEIVDPEGLRAVSLDALAVEIRLLPLLSSTVHVRELALEGLSAVVLDGEGRVAAARAFEPREPAPEEEPSGEPFGWTVELADVRLDDVAAEVSPAADALGVKDLSLRARLRLTPDGLRWDDVELKAVAVRAPVEAVTIRTAGTLGSEHVALDRLEVEAAPHRLSLHGRMDGFEAPAFDLTVDAGHVDLDHLAGVLGVPELHGAADLSGTVRGPLSDLAATLAVGGPWGSLVVKAGADVASETLAARAELAGTDVRPGALWTGAEAAGALDFTVTASLRGDPLTRGAADAKVVVTRVTAVPDAPLPLVVTARAEDGALTARVAASGERAGEVVVEAAAPGLPPGPATARVTLAGVDLAVWAAMAGLPPVKGQVASLTVDGRADLGAAGVASAAARVALRATDLDVPAELGAAAQVASVELDADLAWPGAGLPTGTVALAVVGAAAEGATVGGARLDATLAPAGEALRASGVLRVSEPAYGEEAGARAVDVPFDLRLVDGAPRSGTATVTVAGGRGADWSARRAEVRARLATPGDGHLVVTGPLEVAGVAGPAGEALASATLALEADLAPDGTLAAGAEGEVTGLRGGPSLGVGGATLGVKARLPRGDAGRLEAQGDVLARQLALGEGVGAARARAAFDLRLAGGAPHGLASLRVEELAIPDGGFDVVSLTADLPRGAPGKVTLDATRGDVRARADLALRGELDGEGALEATVEALVLARGEAGLEVRPGGTVRVEPRTGVLEVRGLRVQDRESAGEALEVSARLDPRSGEIRAEADGQGTDVAGWARTAAALGVALPEDALPRGRLGLTAAVTGTLARPVGEVAVTLTDGAWRHLDPLALDVWARLDTETARARVQAAWLGDRKVDLALLAPIRRPAQGDTALDLDSPFLANLKVEHLVLEDAAPWLEGLPEAPPRGLLNGTVKGHGSFRHPIVTGDLAATDVVFGPLEDARFSAELALEEKATRLELVLTEATRERLRVELGLPVNLVTVALSTDEKRTLLDALGPKTVRGVLQIARAPLSDLPFTRGLDALRHTEAEANLIVGGTVAAPRLAGKLAAYALPLGAARAAVKLDMGTKEDVFAAQLGVTSDGRPMADAVVRVPNLFRHLVAGRDPVELLDDEGLSVTLTSTLTQRTLVELEPGLGELVANAVADPLLDAAVMVRGGRGQQAVTVRADIVSAVPVRPTEELGLASGIHVSARLDEAGTRATLVVTQGSDGGGLALDASLPLTVADALAGRVDDSLALRGSLRSSDLLFAGLHRALPSIFHRSPGRLEGALELGGTVGAPTLDGRLAARFDVLRLAPLGLEQKDVDLVVTVTPEALRLEPLTMSRRGGRFELAATVGLADLDPDRMGLEGYVDMKRFPLVTRRDAELELSGRIDLGGTVGGPSVTGRVALDDGLFQPAMGGRSVQEIGAPEDVVFVTAAGAPVAGDEAGRGPRVQAPSALELDLAIAIPPRSLRVKNDLVDVLLGGNLTVQAQGEAILLKGIVTVLVGTVKLYGREFVVDEDSRVVFDGSRRIDPAMDITARFDISEVDLSALGLTAADDSHIRVHVTGTASAPRLELTSQPPMDETNILSIIAVGHPVGGGTGEEVAMTDRMASLFVGIALGPATRFVTETLPIDVFEVEAGKGGDLTAAKVRAGTRITRDLMVMYEANLGAEENENVNQLRVEYDLTRRLKVESHFGDAGKGGVELLLRWRY